MLYTYVDSDDFFFEEKIVNGEEREVNIAYLETKPFKSFVICLATDVDVESLLKFKVRKKLYLKKKYLLFSNFYFFRLCRRSIIKKSFYCQ